MQRPERCDGKLSRTVLRGLGAGNSPRLTDPLKMEKQIMLNTEKLLARITANPRVMVGKPTIRGLRITVEHILRALSGGVSEHDLLEEYPELEREDFQAVFAYAAGLVGEERVFPITVPT